jgi:hypothetical protein
MYIQFAQELGMNVIGNCKEDPATFHLHETGDVVMDDDAGNAVQVHAHTSTCMCMHVYIHVYFFACTAISVYIYAKYHTD